MREQARIARTLGAALGVGTLTAIVAPTITAPFWETWWFWTAVGTAAVTVFAEPFFTKPQDALTSSVGAIALYFGADRESVSVLWDAYLLVASIVLCGALVSMAVHASSESLAKRWAYHAATTLGRAKVMGGVALSIESFRFVLEGEPDYWRMPLGVGGLLVSLAIDWHRLFKTWRSGALTDVMLVGATSPRLVTIAVGGRAIAAGTRVNVQRGKSVVGGSVVGNLATPQGLRLEVALDEHWTASARNVPEIVSVTEQLATTPLGCGVITGGSDTEVRMKLFASLDVGTPLCLAEDPTSVLQLSAVELRTDPSSGGRELALHARAQRLGRLDNGWVRFEPATPIPHGLVRRPTDLSGELPDGYARLGVMKGTQIPIGIRVASANRGHLAILGMSGMGKTAVTNRICRAYGNNSMVLALDLTGEYHTRLGFAKSTDDWSTLGYSVKDLAGDPVKSARQCVEEILTVASSAYKGLESPVPRVIVMEEAHTYLPENNISSFPHKEEVGLTTRYVMQSRKLDLTFVFVSQRTAVISKSALSQCESYIVLRTLDETSHTYLQAAIGETAAAAVSRLTRFEAICYGPAFNAESPVIVQLDKPVASPVAR